MESNHWKAINPIWHLVDPLSVEQAAALIVGFEPNAIDPSWQYFKSQETGLTCSDGINSVRVALQALANSINAGKLKAVIRRTAWERGWSEEPGDGETYEEHAELLDSDIHEAYGTQDPRRIRFGGIIYRVSPDWGETTVEKEDVCVWLKSKNFASDFFLPEVVSTSVPDYLNPSHSRYAHKLAAAVRAWQAMEDENLRRKRKPIAGMTAWLESRYKEFGLVHKQGGKNKRGEVTHKAGDRNDGAIEQVCKIANWEPDGGSSTTPGN